MFLIWILAKAESFFTDCFDLPKSIGQYLFKEIITVIAGYQII